MEIETIQAILSKKEDILRRHLVLSTSVIEKLHQMDVIGKYTRDQLMGNFSDNNKQFMLLMVCLRTRGLPAFQGFLNVLRMTFHGWLADDILDSTIDTSVSTGPTKSVREFLNTMNYKYIQEQQLKYKPVYISESEYPYIPYMPKEAIRVAQESQYGLNGGRRLVTSRSLQRRREYSMADRTKLDFDKDEKPLISQIPENLRDMQKVFDNEASVNRKSIAILRQEEITIKALLQQNLREQQDMLMKQEALQEIKDKMKDLGKTATLLYKPDPDAHVTKARLTHLQKIPWSSSR